MNNVERIKEGKVNEIDQKDYKLASYHVHTATRINTIGVYNIQVKCSTI